MVNTAALRCRIYSRNKTPIAPFSLADSTSMMSVSTGRFREERNYCIGFTCFDLLNLNRVNAYLKMRKNQRRHSLGINHTIPLLRQSRLIHPGITTQCFYGIKCVAVEVGSTLLPTRIERIYDFTSQRHSSTQPGELNRRTFVLNLAPCIAKWLFHAIVSSFSYGQSPSNGTRARNQPLSAPDLVPPANHRLKRKETYIFYKQPVLAETGTLFPTTLYEETPSTNRICSHCALETGPNIMFSSLVPCNSRTLPGDTCRRGYSG